MIVDIALIMFLLLRYPSIFMNCLDLLGMCSKQYVNKLTFLIYQTTGLNPFGAELRVFNSGLNWGRAKGGPKPLPPVCWQYSLGTCLCYFFLPGTLWNNAMWWHNVMLMEASGKQMVIPHYGNTFLQPPWNSPIFFMYTWVGGSLCNSINCSWPGSCSLSARRPWEL